AMGAEMTLEQPGGKMVVELVGAFNDLTERMSHAAALSSSSSGLLFKALKIAIPILHSLPPLPDGRSPLSKALSVAVVLADLQMDAEVISVGILREAVEGGVISLYEVRDRIGTGTAHLLHECMRLRNISLKVQELDEDDDASSALRRFCLTFYDVRAIILDLVLKLDTMRHLDHLPRFKQQSVSLEVMKIYAPLAHAVGSKMLSHELEDRSFQHLFPYSYAYVDAWLKSHEAESGPLIDACKEQLLRSLKSDPSLNRLTRHVSVEGRFKSRYSTMKKLLRDGRKPEQVNDVLGLRVVLNPSSAAAAAGENACYRAREIVRSLWKEIPSRSKDYITNPKSNGYRSLHLAVDVSDDRRRRPLMEIQIRTAEMDVSAEGGTASHALYKGGLTEPEEAKRLKAIMVAAAELAALRLRDFPSAGLEADGRNRVFRLLDKNGDGKISIEELTDVMEELGARGEDAREMMQLLDSNSDGCLSSEEFDLFQKQVHLMRNLEYRDAHYQTLLSEKLQMGK
ncbi:hypothetical protein M569_02655, partial [Genlisea aurea]